MVGRPPGFRDSVSDRTPGRLASGTRDNYDSDKCERDSAEALRLSKEHQAVQTSLRHAVLHCVVTMTMLFATFAYGVGST